MIPIEVICFLFSGLQWSTMRRSILECGNVTARAINSYTRSKEEEPETRAVNLDGHSDSQEIFAVYFVSPCFRVLVCYK